MLKKRFENIWENEKVVSFLSILLAIAGGLLIGFIVILIINPRDSVAIFFTILSAGFIEGSSSIGDLLKYATPVILTGLSVAFAFKTGLFNIGSSGQIAVASAASLFVGVKVKVVAAPWHWIICILVALLAGLIWGGIVGLLKAFFNVHEVVSSIMLNYIGMYFSLFVVRTYIYDSSRAQNLPVRPSAALPSFGLDKLFPGSNLNIGILIAIFSAIIIYIVLDKTRLGYELKAVGFNKDAAKYAGINYKKNIIVSMMIAGALSGLAAASLYLHRGNGKMIETAAVLVGEGFDGIPVALLALSNPLGVIFSGMFLGYLGSAEFYVQAFDIEPEVIQMIVSIIFYVSALSLFLNKKSRSILKTIFKGKNKEEEKEDANI